MNRTKIAAALASAAKEVLAAKPTFSPADIAWLKSRKFAVSPSNEWAKRQIGEVEIVVFSDNSGLVGAIPGKGLWSLNLTEGASIPVETVYGHTAEKAVQSLGVYFANKKTDAAAKGESKLAALRTEATAAIAKRESFAKRFADWKKKIDALVAALK